MDKVYGAWLAYGRRELNVDERLLARACEGLEGLRTLAWTLTRKEDGYSIREARQILSRVELKLQALRPCYVISSSGVRVDAAGTVDNWAEVEAWRKQTRAQFRKGLQARMKQLEAERATLPEIAERTATSIATTRRILRPKPAHSAPQMSGLLPDLSVKSVAA